LRIIEGEKEIKKEKPRWGTYIPQKRDRAA
jgi:hypothetical protein